MSLTLVDLFCGAGGSSIGYTAAGFRLVLAANHWQRAIETHAANFPNAEHLCENVNEIDMRRLPKANILHASPICTEVSPAGGNRRVAGAPGQMDLLEEGGHVPKAAYERTRATFHDVIRATEVHRYQAVVVENVPDVVTKWELFDWWVQGMCLLGYNVQYVSASSAHIWGPGNAPAPQWRDRLYLVFTRTGIRLPDVAPQPLAPCEPCGVDVEAVQWFKKPGRQVGKYRSQYLYRCPNRECRHSIVEPYVRPAADIIDWNDPGHRIGDRKKPLVPNTLRRIRAGLDTLTGSAGMLVPSGGTWNDTASRIEHPLRTRTARDMEAVVTPQPFMTLLRSGRIRTIPVTSPLATLMTEGSGHCLIQPSEFVTGDKHLVMPYYSNGQPKAATEPLSTLTTRDRFALLATSPQVDDCYLRMLRPRENLRGQRFPDSYIVLGNQGEQTMQAGNAVSSNVTQWIGNALAEVL